MRFRRVLVDLSGTLHIDDVATPNAVNALQKLRTSGRSVLFVTNTTKESGQNLFDRLKSLGFEVQRNEMFSSLAAARRLVERQQLRPMYFLTESALSDFADLPASSEPPNAVVVGLAPDQFHYERLTEAMRVLLQPGSQLVAIHKARYYARKDGLAIGPGAFVAGLEYSAGKEATIVGKPTREFYLEALRAMSGDAERDPEQDLPGTLMIGDDPWDDVEGAMKVGMAAILVQTGKYRQGDEQKLAQAPLAVCENFAAAVDTLFEKDPPSAG